MDNLIEILMNRDGFTYDEAKNMLEEVREEMLDAIAVGDDDEAKMIFQERLRLEPDYLMDILYM